MANLYCLHYLGLKSNVRNALKVFQSIAKGSHVRKVLWDSESMFSTHSEILVMHAYQFVKIHFIFKNQIFLQMTYFVSPIQTNHLHSYNLFTPLIGLDLDCQLK